MLRVTIHNAQGLKRQRKLDPYVELSAGFKRFSTHVASEKGTNPKWEQTFSFLYEGERSLDFLVKDKDLLSSADTLGEATLKLNDHLLRNGFTGDLPLTRDDGRIGGSLHVTVSCGQMKAADHAGHPKAAMTIEATAPPCMIGMNPNMMTMGMNPNMMTMGMNPNMMTAGMNPNMMTMGMNTGMNPNMMTTGMNPAMMTMGMNPNMMTMGMNPHMMTMGMNPNMMTMGMNPNMMTMPNMMGMGANANNMPYMGYNPAVGGMMAGMENVYPGDRMLAGNMGGMGMNYMMGNRSIKEENDTKAKENSS